jgi:diguanylate cyclase (GGDEF)-like protein/PAS domain S-box-containing protein
MLEPKKHLAALGVELRLPIAEILVGVMFFTAACTSTLFTRVAGGIALVWPANAIAAALLIRLPRVRWGIAGSVLALSAVTANFAVAHRPWDIAVLFSSLNIAEIGILTFVFRSLWRFPYPRISIEQAAVMVAVFGIGIPGINAVLAGIIIQAHLGTLYFEGLLQWWGSHAVGACLFGPPIILASRESLRRLGGRRFALENVVILAACLVGTYFLMRYVRFPFIGIGVVLIVAAFRVGGFGSALLSLLCGLEITGLWGFGIRPLGVDPAIATTSLEGLPVVALLATLLPPTAVGLGSDARRRMARALRASERRFRESMDHSPIGMLISDVDGRWNYSNLALQSMLGYTAEEFRAMPPGGPSESSEWRSSESRWSRLISGEINFYEVERRFQHKDGSWVWTHVAVSMVHDEDGKPLHLISQIESLEARRRAEEKLAEERERLRITLQSIDDAVITTDAQSRITYLNARAQHLLALDLAAVERRRVDEVMYLSDPATSRAAPNLIGQSLVHGKVFRRESPCLLHRADGTFCYVTDTASPVLDMAGAVTGIVIVLRNSTAEFDRARELAHQAIHDPLTGLVNRAEFQRRSREVLVKGRHLDERPAALIALDLDRFKLVNDTGGHAAGDAVLRKVAEICRHNVRGSDTVARLGGDEFAIVLDNCPEQRAVAVAEQLLLALNPLELDWGGIIYRTGASIGLAMRTEQMAGEEEWLAAADAACYAAKRAGRGEVRIASGTAGEGREERIKHAS